ncbi:MAG: hypothetical protein KUG68_04420 [Flavobacteriaceae bacterium]|nr:hypothetical protein [Flavobacteriaceae bacterium]
MKKISLIIALIVIAMGCKGNENNPSDSLSLKDSNQEKQLKRYDIKSGIIKYNTSISGKVIASTITGSGTETRYFKEWGALELFEQESTTTTNTVIMGKEINETTSDHQMTKLDHGESYVVDFKNKTILQQKDLAMEMIKKMHPDKDAGEVGKSMLEGMGGKQIGKEVFLGYQCEIWDLMGVKQWMYKGVVLKSEANLMGITTITEATSATFNSTVPDSNFNLPNYKISKQESFIDNGDDYPDSFDSDEINEADMEKLRNMSFEEWKTLVQKDDPEMKESSDEELRQIYSTIQFMVKKRN